MNLRPHEKARLHLGRRLEIVRLESLIAACPPGIYRVSNDAPRNLAGCIVDVTGWDAGGSGWPVGILIRESTPDADAEIAAYCDRREIIAPSTAVDLHARTDPRWLELIACYSRRRAA